MSKPPEPTCGAVCDSVQACHRPAVHLCLDCRLPYCSTHVESHTVWFHGSLVQCQEVKTDARA